MVIPDQSQVFDQVAPGWHGFRYHTIFEAELKKLAERWKNGKLLNIGCGHGADFLPFKDSFELFGIDFSSEMLKLAEKYAVKNRFKAVLKSADMRKLPFDDGYFDYAIAVASLHHLPGHTAQLQALSELARVLKPGGEAFLTVWNRTQRRFWGMPKEILLPWRGKDGSVERYYYLFTYGEIEKLAKRAGFVIEKSFPEIKFRFPIKLFSRNICLHVAKPSNC